MRFSNSNTTDTRKIRSHFSVQKYTIETRLTDFGTTSRIDFMENAFFILNFDLTVVFSELGYGFLGRFSSSVYSKIENSAAKIRRIWQNFVGETCMEIRLADFGIELISLETAISDSNFDLVVVFRNSRRQDFDERHRNRGMMWKKNNAKHSQAFQSRGRSASYR